MGLPADIASENTVAKGSSPPIKAKASHQAMYCMTSRCLRAPNSRPAMRCGPCRARCAPPTCRLRRRRSPAERRIAVRDAVEGLEQQRHVLSLVHEGHAQHDHPARESGGRGTAAISRHRLRAVVDGDAEPPGKCGSSTPAYGLRPRSTHRCPASPPGRSSACGRCERSRRSRRNHAR